jgi:outer membrane protein, heavy metal efflux system
MGLCIRRLRPRGRAACLSLLVMGTLSCWTAGTAHGADQRIPVPTTQSTPVVSPPQSRPALGALALPQRFNKDPAAVARELDHLIKEAVENNPDLAAARERVRAARARVMPAGMPDDPTVGFRMKDLPTTFSMTRENATEKQIVATQRYPFPGKLGLRRKVAAKQADMTRDDLHSTILHLITEVRSAFDDVFVADKDIELVLEQRRMLSDLADIATSKYRVGPGLQQDVLNADVAISRLDSTLIELSRRRQSRQIQLAVLLNRDNVSIPPLGTLPPVNLTHTALELEQMAEETNPEIRRLSRAVERDELQVTLAERAVLPDFVVDAAYGSRQDHPAPASASALSRPDLITAQITMSVPIFYFSKQREQIDEARANLARTRFRLAAERRKLLGRLHDLLARLAQHEQVAASFQKEVVPIARTAVSAAISAYRVDQVDFMTLLSAQEKLDDYETEYWHNRAEGFRDRAEIDEVTGAVLVEDGWNK